MIRRALFLLQRALATITYALASPIAARKRAISWLVGPHEVASMVLQVASAIPGSYTIVDHPHAYYHDDYDYVLSRSHGSLAIAKRMLWGPIIFGMTLARARGAIYVGNLGYLTADVDERAWEFEFIRKRHRHVVVIFTGNDIRSPALMSELAEQTGFDNIGAILARQGAPFNTREYERQREVRSRVADKYASVIFTARVDQLSYLTSATHAFPYLYRDDRFPDVREKFSRLERIRVVHAPSRPELKGTAVIREVVRQLQKTHPELKYVELTNVRNEEVRAELLRAHIVVNQLHAYVPGVFGIEAMAHQCVMICSADPAVETDLLEAEKAWVVADTSNLHQQLEGLLQHPEKLLAQALLGQEWTQRFASQSATGARLRKVLDNLVWAPSHDGTLPPSHLRQ